MKVDGASQLISYGSCDTHLPRHIHTTGYWKMQINSLDLGAETSQHVVAIIMREVFG